MTAFSSNRMRLSAGQWLIVFAVMVPFVGLASPLWKSLEEFEHPLGYRIPYDLSRDYWLYERHLEQSVVEHPQPIFVVGDSVVWGEFVRRDGTLSHFLGDQTNHKEIFVNAGVNGVFPLALEGLVRAYGDSLRGQRVILHCNLLWMSSPEADLSTSKEQKFNHAQLVPQFWPSIPCYKANVEERLSTVMSRRSGFLAWNAHIQMSYFGAKTIPLWTLADGHSSPSGANAYAMPWTPVTLRVPTEPQVDAERGSQSPRHRAWSDRGLQRQDLDWVAPEDSLQWAAYRRLVTLLRARSKDLLVIVGPFNEHLLTPTDRVELDKWKEVVAKWLRSEQVPLVTPATLRSNDYADASHPLTSGYRELARRVASDPEFQSWLSPPKVMSRTR